MTNKRKKDNTSPPSGSKRPKKKMASNNNGNNISSQNSQFSALPPISPMTQMTPMYSIPNYYHQTSPVFPMQAMQPPPLINSDLLQRIIQRQDSRDNKLGQLNSIQASVSKITDRLNNMEHQINSIERSQNFMSDQYDQINACSVSNKHNIAKLQAEVVFIRCKCRVEIRQ
jgi:hypothetical protein